MVAFGDSSGGNGSGWMPFARSDSAKKDPGPWSCRISTDRSAPTDPRGRSNAISSTKYSPLTWLPKSIWVQFRRLANLYFLLISVLQILGA